jgi:hypothetical protein
MVDYVTGIGTLIESLVGDLDIFLVHIWHIFLACGSGASLMISYGILHGVDVHG